PDGVHKVRITWVRGDRLLVEPDRVFGVASEDRRLAPRTPTVQRPAGQDGLVRIALVERQADRMRDAVRPDRHPGVRGALIVAAGCGRTARAAGEMGQRSGERSSAIEGVCGNQSTGGVVVPEVLLPEDEQIGWVARVHGQRWLNLCIAVVFPGPLACAFAGKGAEPRGHG